MNHSCVPNIEIDKTDTANKGPMNILGLSKLTTSIPSLSMVHDSTNPHVGPAIVHSCLARDYVWAEHPGMAIGVGVGFIGGKVRGRAYRSDIRRRGIRR